jgi:hypothetical protein
MPFTPAAVATAQCKAGSLENDGGILYKASLLSCMGRAQNNYSNLQSLTTTTPATIKPSFYYQSLTSCAHQTLFPITIYPQT